MTWLGLTWSGNWVDEPRVGIFHVSIVEQLVTENRLKLRLKTVAIRSNSHPVRRYDVVGPDLERELGGEPRVGIFHVSIVEQLVTENRLKLRLKTVAIRSNSHPVRRYDVVGADLERELGGELRVGIFHVSIVEQLVTENRLKLRLKTVAIRSNSHPVRRYDVVGADLERELGGELRVGIFHVSIVEQLVTENRLKLRLKTVAIRSNSHPVRRYDVVGADLERELVAIRSNSHPVRRYDVVGADLERELGGELRVGIFHVSIVEQLVTENRLKLRLKTVAIRSAQLSPGPPV
ncbi:unnamed protein product, partial [Iphiclides podalirius]